MKLLFYLLQNKMLDDKHLEIFFSYDIQQAGFDTDTTGSSVAIKPKVEYVDGVDIETVGYVKRGADGKYYDGSGKPYEVDKQGEIHVDGSSYPVVKTVPVAPTVSTSVVPSIQGKFVSYNPNHGTATINYNGVDFELSGDYAKGLSSAKAGQVVNVSGSALPLLPYSG